MYLKIEQKLPLNTRERREHFIISFHPLLVYFSFRERALSTNKQKIKRKLLSHLIAAWRAGNKFLCSQPFCLKELKLNRLLARLSAVSALLSLVNFERAALAAAAVNARACVCDLSENVMNEVLVIASAWCLETRFFSLAVTTRGTWACAPLSKRQDIRTALNKSREWELYGKTTCASQCISSLRTAPQIHIRPNIGS
jgi:hypothetical protein